MIFIMRWLTILFFLPLFGHITFDVKPITRWQKEILVTIPVEKDEWLYKDFLNFSVDSPHLTIRRIDASHKPVNHYDPSFKEPQRVYKEDVTFTIQITNKAQEPESDASLHVQYFKNSHPGPQEELISLVFAKQESKQIPEEKKTSIPTSVQSKKIIEEEQSWSEYIASLLGSSKSIWFQLFLVFILGVLLSLTPCIYPMVPITIGILQSQGSKSLLNNFLLSLSYTFGMAMTYAVFGLLASCVGPLCGQLLVQPIFVIGLVLILGYLAFSMFGFYDMYIPQLMQKQHKFKSGSFLSTFIFGAASGTIASPCVSPGLALVLTVVATLGNQLLGFLLLFAFGVGLSIPLLIIGTFSSSLNMLPQAGIWMVEVKRFFGFMMLAMCFYYLSYVTPFDLLLWIIALITFIVGIFYLAIAHKNHSPFWKQLNQLIGFVLIVSSLLLAFYAYKETMKEEVCKVDTFWQTDFNCALALAKKENKRIFIDFWATFCPVCLAINKKVLPDPTIKSALENYINLKVDGTYATNETYAQLKDKFSITGFPIYLIYDPKTDKEIVRWGSEIYEMNRGELVELLQAYSVHSG